MHPAGPPPSTSRSQSISFSSGFSIVNSYRVPYFVDAGMAVIALLLVLWKIQDTGTISKSNPHISREELVDKWKKGVHNKCSYS
jgi:hypothetical protein